eukprot:SAG31_NODE_4312_length_3366_cov_245.528926_3_plen_53_part_00
MAWAASRNSLPVQTVRWTFSLLDSRKSGGSSAARRAAGARPARAGAADPGAN